MKFKCASCSLKDCNPTACSGRYLQTIEGVTNRKIMIVSDFPHDGDNEGGSFFVTSKHSGNFIKLLLSFKIPLKDVYLTGLVKCTPFLPGSTLKEGTIKREYIDACSPYLMEELVNVNPEMLILFGEKVFSFFHPDKLFTDNRGKLLHCDTYNVMTLATYNPISMAYTNKFDQIIRADIKKAAEHVYGAQVYTEKPVKDYRFPLKDLSILRALNKRLKEVDTFACDIETHGEGLFNYKLLSIGFSYKEHTGVSVPVWVKDEVKEAALKQVANYEIPKRTKDEPSGVYKDGTVRYKKVAVKGFLEEDRTAIRNLLPAEYADLATLPTLTAIKQRIRAILDKEPPLKKYWGAQHDECMALIKEIMENDTPKGFHNGGYDVNRLRGIGINVKNYAWDTILMHHLLDEERPHGLDDLSFVYTKDGGYKSEKNKYLTSSKTSWSNIPTAVILPYNAQDADVTLQLYHIFKEKLQKEGKLWNLFNTHVMPAQHMLLDMSFRGSDVDLAWINKTQSEYQKRMKELVVDFQIEMNTVLPNCYVVANQEEEKAYKEEMKESGAVGPAKEIINLSSNRHMVHVFRDLFKAKLTKKTATGDALDANVLKKIAKKVKAAKILLEYKELAKLDSTYLTGMKESIDTDGKIHGEFVLYGTVTGRLSSKRPNMQNISGDMKYMFVPPKGYLCVNVDQSAAELHVLAWMARDKKMMDIFENRRDLHRETAAGVFNKKPEDISDAERKIAKRCFSSDSFILTEDGYIRGKDIGSRQVYTLDGKLQNQHHVFEERDGLKITLRNGMQLKVTTDHKFQDFTHLTPTWKEANQFKVGDVIGFLKNVQTPTDYVMLHNDVKLKTHTKRYPEYIPLDEDFAYLIGCLLSDGSVHNQYKHCLASHVSLIGKYEQQSKFNGAFGTKFGINVRSVKGKYTHYGISSVELAHLLDRLCGRRKEKHIPDELFRSPKSVVDSFISGMIDGDGNTTKGVVHFDNTNERLVDGLCELATLYGYAVTKRQEEYHVRIKMNKNPDKVYNGICYACTFVSKPDLTLAIKHKAEGLAKKSGTTPFVNTWPILLPEVKTLKGKSHDISYLNYNRGLQKGLPDAFVTRWNLPHKEYWSSEIKSIEPVKFEALIMETDTHFFIGEGLSSHNCSFGTAYGISGKGLAELLEPEGVKITENQGNKYIDAWRQTYKSCAYFLDNSQKIYKYKGFLENPFGRRRHKYKVFTDNSKESSSARQACNYPIQSTASDIQIYEMVHMYPTLLENGILPVFTVHDSIVMYCPVDKLEWLRDYYKKETCRRFNDDKFPGLHGCLMYTEMEVGRNYGEHVKLPYDCDFQKWKEENKFLFDI